jgi:uncharacterized protein with PIN domain
LDFGNVPNSIEWLMISDTRFDEFTGNVDAEELYAEFEHFLKCSKCGRLWMFWNGFKHQPACYEPTDE